MQDWCPEQATRDALPYVNYYCEMATGGSPTLSLAVQATATEVVVGDTAGALATGGNPGSSGSAKAGAGVLDPTLSIGAGIVVVLGVLMGLL